MNEHDFNDHTCGRQFSLVRVGRRRWRASEWSAFMVSMLLPNILYNSYLQYHVEQKEVFLEINPEEVSLLEMRCECLPETDKDTITFESPFPVAESLFMEWKRYIGASIQAETG